MKSRLVLFSFALALTACATSEPIKGPDGTPHILVTCNDVKDCYTKATEDCGGKYQIVNSSSEVVGSADLNTKTNLLVKCLK